MVRRSAGARGLVSRVPGSARRGSLPGSGNERTGPTRCLGAARDAAGRRQAHRSEPRTHATQRGGRAQPARARGRATTRTPRRRGRDLIRIKAKDRPPEYPRDASTLPGAPMSTRRPHVVFALVFLTACAGGDSPTDPGPDPDTSGPPTIASVVVSPAGVTIPVGGLRYFQPRSGTRTAVTSRTP